MIFWEDSKESLMADELQQEWKQAGRFYGVYGGYTVQAFKYVASDGEVGWHTTSWPMRDPIHDFWVSGTNFHRMTLHLMNPTANHRNTLEILGIVENVDPKERKAVLEAIQDWNEPVQPMKLPASPVEEVRSGIPYKIEGFRTRVMELSDPTGPDNVIDGDLSFVLTIGREQHLILVHAKLVMESNLFDREMEVYPPEVPAGVVIRTDELNSAVRGYMFAFLNTDEALKDYKDYGIFS
jgi:hypothetical protein